MADFSKEVNTGAVAGAEYLLRGSTKDKKERTGEVLAENALVSDVVKGRRDFSFNAQVVGNDGGAVEVPIFAYKGYVAKTEGGTLPISFGKNNVIRLNLSQGFNERITVRFVSPWYWRLSEILSLLSFLALIFFFIKRRNYARK